MVKSKKLWLGIIAIVACLALIAAGVVIFLNQDGGEEQPQDEVQTSDVYWNVDREQYLVQTESGLSARKRDKDGFWHIRFFVNGQITELKVADSAIVSAIDNARAMGLEFDEEGTVIGVIDIDDMPVTKVAWNFFVKSVGKKKVKFNSSTSFEGINAELTLAENCEIYDMTGHSGEPGTKTELLEMDRVCAFANEDGEVYLIFVYERQIVKVVNAYCDHCDEEAQWVEWTDSKTLPVESGHYFLSGDITLRDQQSILENNTEICLDLNGKTVTGARNCRVYALFEHNITLSIFDSSEEKTGVLKAIGESPNEGGVIWVRYKDGTCNLYGGTLDGSEYYLVNAEVYEGDNVYYVGKHGATVNTSGTFNMYSGTIIGGTTYRTKNCPWELAGNGGSVCVMPHNDTEAGIFNLYDGEIYGGIANAGGNIQLYGEMNMYGGKIYGGQTKNASGELVKTSGWENVFIVNGTLSMSGGEIAGHVQAIDTAAGDQYAATINLSGTAFIYGAEEGYTNVTLHQNSGDGVTINVGKMEDGACIGVTASGVFTTNTDPENAKYFYSDIPGTVVEYQGGLAVALRTSSVEMCECGGKAVGVGDHVCTNLQWTEVPGNSAMNPAFFVNGGNFKLTGNVTLTESIMVSANAKQLRIDLNGHTISVGNGSRVINTWLATNLETLTVTDSSASGNGRIKVFGTANTEGGCVAATNGVVFKLYGGILDASQYTMTSDWAGGAAVFVFGNSKFYMYGGEILGGKCTLQNGSAVDIYSTTAQMTMYGGVIRGGYSDNSGGNIRVLGSMNLHGGEIYGGSVKGSGGNLLLVGTFNMTGGKIYGGDAPYGYNVASYGGTMNLSGGEIVGGVSAEGTSKVNLSGSIKINAGEGYNLKLGDEANVIVNGEVNVAQTANIKVSASVGRVFATGSGVELNDTNKAFFASEVESTEITVKDGGFAITLEATDIHGCECGGKAEDNENHTCNDLTWIEVPGNEALNPSFFAGGGSFKLMGDVTVTDQIIISGNATELHIDLNGYTLTKTGGERVLNGWAATNLVSLTITDSSEAGTGKITTYGNNSIEGGIIAAANNMTVTIYAGTLDASQYTMTSTWAGGSAIFMTGNSKLYLYGGEIIGGTSTKNGSTIDINSATAEATIYDGSIHGGRSGDAGGNIRVNGTLNIYGGEIYGGAANGAGNIIVTGKMNMTGGSIYGGSGSFGYNIYSANANITFTGGEIVGGVQLGSGTTLNISGDPKLSAGEGYNLHLDAGANIVVNGELTVNESANMIVSVDTYRVFATGSGLELNESNIGFFATVMEGAEIVIQDGGFAIQQKGCEHNWTDATCTTPKTCSVCGAIEGEALGHSWVDATYEAPKTCSVCGATEGEPLEKPSTCECGGKAIGIGDHICNEIVWIEVPANEALDPSYFANGGNFKLMGDVTVTDQIVISASATELHFDLNGYTLKNSLGIRLINGWAATNLNHLTITDSSSAGTGKMLASGTFDVEGGIIAAAHNMTVKIYAGTLDASSYNLTSTWAGGSAIFATLNSKVYIYGGEIIGGSATQNGGTIDIADPNASVTIYGGSIHGGRSNGAGGNIRVAGTLNIHGGEIYGGAAGGAGNILLTGKLNMTGGKIHGGSGSFGYNLYTAESVINFTGGEIVGGVELGGNTTLNISGDPKLNAGAGYNLAPSGNVIVVNGAVNVGETPNIKVLASAGTVFAMGDGVELNESNIGFFGSDSADTVVAMKDGGFAIAEKSCEHSWTDATCDTPKTCSLCGETEGSALGHAWVDATCTAPKTCSACGVTEGEALGHSWVDATYEAPKTCTVCGATEGEPLVMNCECGGKAIGIGDHICNEIVWIEVPANEALDPSYFANGGNFKLMGDVSVTDQIAISASATELHIDLNGYTLKTTFGFRLFSGWGATSLNSLTVTDSSAAGTGKLQAYGTFEAEGGIIAAIHNMTVKIYAGTLDASGYNLTSTWAGGSAIFATLNSKVYIYGGEIIGGSATQNGGAIDIADANASVTIYGGKIHGGRSNGAGGNIRVAGTLNIHGGEIYGGAAGGAGNILLTGKLNMTGGKIYGGSGSFGYNLYTAESVINFTGGEIVGGVQLGANTTLNLSGDPKINAGEGYNLHLDAGANIVVNGTLTVNENANIIVTADSHRIFATGSGVELNEGNIGFFATTMDGAAIVMQDGGFAIGCAHSWAGPDCTNPKTCTVCGATRGEALGHAWTAADCTTPKTCSVCGATDGSALGHAWVDATCTAPKTCSACGVTEGEALGHSWVDATYEAPKTCTVCGATEGEPLVMNCECGGKAIGIGDHVCSNLTWTEVPANEALDPSFFAGGGNFKLMGDVSVTDQIAISASATELHIDLNGYTLKTTFGFRLFSGWGATSLNSLTITDSSAAGTGKLQAYGTFEAEGGIIAAIHNMTVKIYAGTLDASGYNLTSTWAGGSAIFATLNSKVYIYGGEIIGGSATQNGGAIDIADANASVTIYGGKIHGGRSNGAGGNIRVAGTLNIHGGEIYGGAAGGAGNILLTGKLNMTGGKIHGGSGSFGYNLYTAESVINFTGGEIVGGVELGGNTTLNISGDPKINAGEGYNLHLDTGANIVVNGTLTVNENANIIVTADSHRIFATGSGVELNEGNIGFFATTMDGAAIVMQDSGFAIGCAHSWAGPDCTNPKTCTVCGATRGEALGHAWTAADCTTPKTCSVCGVTDGSALGHAWVDATCTTPKTCSVCGATDGSALGHAWVDANCTTPKTCSACGVTEGEALGHSWVDATYEAPKTCTACGATEGEPLVMNCECGGKAIGIGDHVCSNLTWTEVPANEALDPSYFANGGNFKLMGDVSVTDQIAISASATELHIDLNGYTLKTTFGFRLFSGWGATSLTSLTVTDSSAAGTGKLQAYGTFEAEGGIIAAIHNMTVKIYAGTLDASGYNLTSTWAGGSAIFATLNSKVYIYGGEIIGGSATQNGGAIDIADANASVTIYGGSIHGGRSNGAGGNIRVAGTLNIHGGEVYGGAAGGAGNILLTGKLNMTGGKIHGGSGSFGYNLYTAESVINFTGGEIVGGVELGGNTTLNISGDPKLNAGAGYNLAPGGNVIVVNGALNVGETPNIKVLASAGTVFAMGDGVELNESNIGFFGSDSADTVVAMKDGGFAVILP